MSFGRIATAARAAVLIAATGLISLGRPGPAEAAMEGVWLHGAGATFPAPLYNRWIEVYQKDHPGLSMTYDAVGSGEGVSRFISGLVDFGATDAAISDTDIAKVANGVMVVPATAGMVVLAYNVPGMQADLKLPRDVYADIFAGRITRWDDPRLVSANPDLNLPRRTIAVVARQDASGTTAAFSRHLQAISKSWQDLGLRAGSLVDWPAGAMLARGNEGVAGRIKISQGSLGYVEYGFANRLGLPVAALQNKAGRFVKPSEETGQLALAEATTATADDLRLSVTDPAGDNSYPVVTYSWLLLYKQYADVGKGAAIRDFVTWGLSMGQGYGGELGYIPLPKAVAARSKEAVASVR